MKLGITKRQKELLSAIYKYIASTGYPPSFEEMKEGIKVSSNQSVIDLLGKLAKQGFIRREEGQARGIKILSKGFEILGLRPIAPFAGTSSAGSFIESYAGTFDKWVPLNSGAAETQVARTAEEVFVIQIRGDSMIDVGINDNDILLIKKTKEFQSGDIVVARNGDGTTVKRFMAKGGRTWLKPENPKYRNLPIYEHTYFDGKVIFNLTTREKIK